MKFFTKVIIILIFFNSFSIFSSCNHEDVIPYIEFYESVYLNLPQYQSVQTPGNYIYLPSPQFGYAGVILYCKFPDEYIAYERNCPYNASKEDAILDISDSLNLMVCRNCGSRFSLMDGGKVSGPAKYDAKRYNTTLQNGNKLDIYN